MARVRLPARSEASPLFAAVIYPAAGGPFPFTPPAKASSISRVDKDPSSLGSREAILGLLDDPSPVVRKVLLAHFASQGPAARLFLEDVIKTGNRLLAVPARGYLEELKFTDDAPTKTQLKLLHKTIKKVTLDTQAMSFNTAISAMMVFINELGDELPLDVWKTFIVLLSPYVPHLAEELWERAGEKPTVSRAPWPAYDDAHTVDDEIEMVFQINGKIRSKLVVPAGLPAAEMEKLARTDKRIIELTDGKEIVKVITVPNKLVNIVVKA